MRSERLTLMTQERLSLALSTGRVSVFEWDVEADNAIAPGPLVEAFGVPVAHTARGMPLEAFLSAIHIEDVDPVYKSHHGRRRDWRVLRG